MSALTLVFPHQLFDRHPAIERGRPVLLVEDSLFFGDGHHPCRFHAQKRVLHRASMAAFVDGLGKRGIDARVERFREGETLEGVLDRVVGREVDALHLCDPVDFLVEKRLRRFARKRPVRLCVSDSPMFVTPAAWADEHFEGRKRPFMAAFYEAQRKRMGVLVEDDGSPVGGRWSFDDENRRPMPKSGLAVPPDPTARRNEWMTEAMASVAEDFPDAPGDPAGFDYPVTSGAAEGWFERFLEERFAGFGPWEDAISRRERVLFHSVLSPMLNIGLLTPGAVVEKAIAFAGEHDVPIQSLEGFVRQVIGWREFMRCMYRRHGVAMRNGNFWGFEERESVPRAFYDGTTGVPPIDDVVRRVREHAWAHHIERLMLVGNFMLLCRIHPHAVYRWFMELFIDAFDWVMVPNVYGMSQFADGGIFTTKPYLSGSNYVRKMSDYPKGDWCDTWDGLFWTFIADHEDFFRSQHRLGMMTRQLDRMDAARRTAHRRNAESMLEKLG